MSTIDELLSAFSPGYHEPPAPDAIGPRLGAWSELAQKITPSMDVQSSEHAKTVPGVEAIGLEQFPGPSVRDIIRQGFVDVPRGPEWDAPGATPSGMQTHPGTVRTPEEVRDETYREYYAGAVRAVKFPLQAVIEQVKRSAGAIEQAMQGNRDPSVVVNLAIPIAAAGLMRVGLFGTSAELGAAGGTPQKITGLVKLLQGNPEFEAEADRIYKFLVGVRNSTVKGAHEVADEMAGIINDPKDWEKIEALVRGTDHEHIGEIAEHYAAMRFYERQIGEGEFELGAAGGRRRTIKSEPGRIMERGLGPDYGPTAVQKIATQLGLRSEVAFKGTGVNKTAYIKIWRADYPGQYVKVRIPHPDDPHSGLTGYFELDTSAAGPEMTGARALSGGWAVQQQARHRMANIAGETYEGNIEALRDRLAYMFGRELPRARPPAPPRVHPDPRQGTLFPAALLEQPAVQQLIAQETRLGTPFGIIANKLQRAGINVSADEVRRAWGHIRDKGVFALPAAAGAEIPGEKPPVRVHDPLQELVM